jgi:hypothetical protein
MNDITKASYLTYTNSIKFVSLLYEGKMNHGKVLDLVIASYRD